MTRDVFSRLSEFDLYIITRILTLKKLAPFNRWGGAFTLGDYLGKVDTLEHFIPILLTFLFVDRAGTSSGGAICTYRAAASSTRSSSS